MVQGQIRRFKQSIRRGPPLGAPSYAACVDLSTSLNEVGSKVDYSPDLARPAPQPVLDSVLPEGESPEPLEDAVGQDSAQVEGQEAGRNQKADQGEELEQAQCSNADSPPDVTSTGARPKTHRLETTSVPGSTAVVVKPNYPVVSSGARPSSPSRSYLPVLSNQVRSSYP